MDKNLIKKSKFLALILRHNPDAGGVKLDSAGWTSVGGLIKNAGFTHQELKEIVENDDKQRYDFADYDKKIRANQGHSIASVKIEFDEVVPPKHLYHGTVRKYVNSIMKSGLQKQGRNYLHLSDSIHTATGVGSRRGKPVILSIDSRTMYDDGYKFYISENGVYLVDFVPAKYVYIYNEYGEES